MTRAHGGRSMLLALVVASAAASDARAQVRIVEPTAAQVANSLRTKGHPGRVMALLTQARGPKAARQLDELADTLTSFAATHPGGDIHAVSARANALSALVLAGQGNTGIDDGTGGVPYAGAAARLMRLAQTAQSGGIRAAALSGLVQLPDSVQYLPFLGKVAVTAQGEDAQAATGLLVHDTGPAGRAIARELYLAGTVTQWSAKRTLDGAAQRFGWRRP